MEVYRPNRESVPCACGGRRSNIPDVIRRHNETYKHTTWQFQRLCCELLTADRKTAVALLMEMRALVRTGRVL